MPNPERYLSSPVCWYRFIGVGFYPKLLTQIYDPTTTALTAHLRDSVPTIAHKQSAPVAIGEFRQAPKLTKATAS